jgi:hypothetical protein
VTASGSPKARVLILTPVKQAEGGCLSIRPRFPSGFPDAASWHRDDRYERLI